MTPEERAAQITATCYGFDRWSDAEPIIAAAIREAVAEAVAEERARCATVVQDAGIVDAAREDILAAVAAEREVCALLTRGRSSPREIAVAIRARGEQP